ncbi:hypothetical protein B1T44_29220, partial [Mycobacterium persicum]
GPICWLPRWRASNRADEHPTYPHDPTEGPTGTGTRQNPLTGTAMMPTVENQDRKPQSEPIRPPRQPRETSGLTEIHASGAH